jgi:hypothetical protein
LIRRGIIVVAILAGIGGSAALASARSVARSAQSSYVTSTVSKPVTSSGRYLVVVRLRARTQSESVTVYLSGAAKRRLHLSSRTATTLRYHLTVKQMPTKLTVRVVSPQPVVALAMSLEPEPATPAPSTPAPTPAAPSGATSPASTGPAQYPNPYTNLVWDDEFNGSAGTAPSSANWTVENGQGNCGGGTLNANTSDPANIEQNGQGQLAITALDNGGSYSAAEIWSAPVTSFPYGAVEASIKLPPGQGLCSQFWLNGVASSGWSPTAATTRSMRPTRPLSGTSRRGTTPTRWSGVRTRSSGRSTASHTHRLRQTVSSRARPGPSTSPGHFKSSSTSRSAAGHATAQATRWHRQASVRERRSRRRCSSTGSASTTEALRRKPLESRDGPRPATMSSPL